MCFYTQLHLCEYNALYYISIGWRNTMLISMVGPTILQIRITMTAIKTILSTITKSDTTTILSFSSIKMSKAVPTKWLFYSIAS